MKREKRDFKKQGRRAFLKGLITSGVGIVVASTIAPKKIRGEEKKSPTETLYHETPEIRKYYETIKS
jgi:hypothetical protein